MQKQIRAGPPNFSVYELTKMVFSRQRRRSPNTAPICHFQLQSISASHYQQRNHLTQRWSDQLASEHGPGLAEQKARRYMGGPRCTATICRARQHAMRAEIDRARCCYDGKFARLSVCPMPVPCLYEWNTF